MLKKIAAYVLTAVLCLSLFAGCAKQDAATDTASADPSQEHMTITVAFQMSESWGNDNICKTIEDKFNVDFQFIDLSWADYVDKLNILVGSGSVPDVFMYPAIDDATTKPIYYQWIDEGVLRALPDDMSPYPTLEGILADFDEIMEYNGHRYQIPRLSWQPENQHFSRGLAVRKDYLEAVGITEVPNTFDGLYDMLVALRDGDPDGNGKNDTIPLTVQSTYAGFVENLFGVPVGWIMEDGQAIPSTLSQNYLECVKFLNQLYEEGLLDPDFATQTEADMKDKFITGKVACIETQFEAQGMQPSIITPMSNLVPNADEVVALVPITEGPFGEVVMTNQYNHWSGTVFSSAMDDAKMDRVMQIFEWVLSGEGMELLRWGIEGEDYKMEDGKHVSLLETDPATGLPKSLFEVKPTANMRNLFSWDIDGTWDFPSISQNIVALEKEHIALYQNYSQTGPVSMIVFYNNPDINNFKYMDLVNSFYTKAILGQYEDIDAEFEALKETIMTTRGGEAAVKAANEFISQ